MGSDHDDYRVHIDRHRATPKALDEAQRALLEQQSSRGPDRRRLWLQRAAVLVAVLAVVGLVLLVARAPSVGRATAHDSCVANAEELAESLSAVELDGGKAAGADAVAELCGDHQR